MSKDIHDFYAEWANGLDSAGKDSTDAQQRATTSPFIEIIFSRLRELIEVTRQLDLLKKWVYYGKADADINLGNRLLPDTLQDAALRLNDHNTIRFLHMLLGMAGEVGEITQPFLLFLETGVPIDPDNIREELGDNSWYALGLGSKWLGDPDHTQILESNYNKLTTRYPEGAWTRDRAVNRDLEKERKALEIRGLDPKDVMLEEYQKGLMSKEDKDRNFGKI